MRSLWIFRTDLRQLESYHQYTTVQEFKKNCWDFYLIQGIWFLENNYFDEVIVWRLTPKNPINDITFKINNKKFQQKFVSVFDLCFMYNPPEISFFRGGFKDYCRITSKKPDHFGTTLYLGAGQRIVPKYGGKYDKILVESEDDLKRVPNSYPFYKTCNPEIFYMNLREPIYDICFLANFTQKSYKGQKFFIEVVSKSKFLKSLDIVHFGNQSDIGKKWCKNLGVNNINFGDHKSRTFLNQIINKSKFGLVCSNLKDGCPRVITEILCCGTPLLIRSSTRLLDYYKRNKAVVSFDDEVDKKIKWAFDNYDALKQGAIDNRENLSLETICGMNYEIWNA